MNSIVISPFWQSADEQWIGATLLAISAMILVSTAIFVARYRSVSFYLVASGILFLAATLLAPKADAQSPRIFQLWLMSPGVLTTLSMLQILVGSIAIFGSLRQEIHAERSGRILHEIRSWIVAILAVLPSPVLLVFIFWAEQNMMISTRQTAPVWVGVQVATVLIVALGVLSLILSRFDRYRLFALHFFVGIFLVLSGALLPCLTVRLSFASGTK